VVSGRISAGFGSSGFEFGLEFSPTFFGFGAPKLIGFGFGSIFGRPRPNFGPVRSPFLLRGSSRTYLLCPLHLHDFDAVILAIKMEALFA
jgi:hypothetical protein